VTSVDLERWLRSGQNPLMDEEGEPSLVCWQSTLKDLQVIHFPVRGWLLICSLVLLGFGLVLVLAPLSRPLFWSCVSLCGLALAALSIFCPGLMPVIAYGCEPGVLVLFSVLAAQWLLQRRYQRKLTFMQGFTRLRTESSLVLDKNGSQPRESSTVDGPAKMGSSPSLEQRSAISREGIAKSGQSA
jgi:hypothetical protein